MAKNKSLASTTAQGRPHWLPTIVSALALGVSLLSYLEARKAVELNLLTSLPAISATVELIEPIQAGKQVGFRVVLENQGKSVAKSLNPEIRFLVSAPSNTFRPDYSSTDTFGNSKPPGTQSDLNPGAKTTLLTTSSFFLPRKEDVDAVTSGEGVLYLYGRATYIDIYNTKHEIHFCRYYRSTPGDEPLKLTFCASYNETV